MPNIIEIELPIGTDPQQAKSLVDELRTLTDVHSTDLVKPKAIDPASLIVWVKLASAALPIITSLVNLIRGRKLQKVRIKAGDHVIEVDSASAREVEALLTSIRKDE